MTNQRSNGAPYKLYRARRGRILLGVCAGIADYLNVSRAGVRVVTLVGLLFFFPFVLLAYLILALFMKTRPEEPLPRDPEEVRFWRSVTLEPGDTLGALRHRFRTLDSRLAHLEREITSKDYELRRQFQDLERAERGRADT
ncbi:MAG: PspC domain-containing protein [Pseudomonadota bacterium]